MRLLLDHGHIDLEDGEVVVEGEARSLSGTEVRLLRYLADHGDRPVAQEELLEEVWGYAATVQSRTVRTTVGRVRQKIERDAKDPQHLITEYGEGYRLVVRAQVEPSATSGRPDGFVGRAEELGRLDAALARHRWVTVVGPGGIGKTRLATAWAGRQALPVTLLEAHGLGRAAELVAAAARRLGVTASRDADEQVVQALAARGPALWIVDNLESVDDPGPVLRQWLHGAPELRLLATSRTPLDVVGEAVLELGPLADDDARDLLVDRLVQARLATPPDPSDPAIEALVEGLEGMPLGLELVAAWADVLPLGELARRLAPELVADDRHDGPARHSSLAAAVEGSWSLLDERDQDALVQACAFVGGAALGDLEAVVGPAALRSVRTLRRSSLLRLEGVRYRVLEPIRQEVARRAADGFDAARRHHRDHFASVASWIGQHTFDPRRDEALKRYHDEHANLHTALSHATGSAPVVAEGMVLDLDGLANGEVGWGDVLGRVVSSTEAGSRLRVARASALRLEGSIEEAEALLMTVLDADDSSGGLALEELARCAFLTDRAEEAEAHVARGLAGATDGRLRGRLLRSRAMLARRRGAMDEALAVFEEAARGLDAAHCRLEAALCRADLAELLGERGQAERAETLLRVAARDVEAEKRPAARASVLLRLGAVVHDRDPDEGRRCLEAAADLAARSGRPRFAAHARWRIATWALDAGRAAAAEAELRSLLVDTEGLGDPAFTATLWANLGCALSDQGDHDGARRCFDQALGDARPTSIYQGWNLLFAGLAALRAGERERGERCLRVLADDPSLRAAPGLCLAAHVLGEDDAPTPPHASGRAAVQALAGQPTEVESWLVRVLGELGGA